MENKNTASITLGGGCFWCVEAVFLEMEGITHVESGYTNGRVKNPTYREVCSGLTGHNEVIRLEYDAEKVTLTEILEVFFKVHDPTTLNRQGNDVGSQYRSGIYYETDEQKEIAEQIIRDLNASGAYPDPIVTEVERLDNYSKAEDYHQDYYRNNSSQPYCRFVVQPKVEKFKRVFADRVKTPA